MITVSIVTHRTPPHLLESVMNALSAEPVGRVFIVDNSPDESIRPLAARWPVAEYIHVPNRGFGNAHNVAIRRAAELGSDYHLVLNPDVRWSAPILGDMTAEMERRPDCALMQPRIVYPDGTLQHTCRLLPTPLDVFGRRFLPAFSMRRRNSHYLLPADAYDREFNAVYMQGSFMLFRTSALMDVGLFDERFFMYPEDIDITRRIRRRSQALYWPGAVVVHDHAAASSRFGRMLWIHIVNMCRYFNKWGWFFDRERRRLNRELLNHVKTLQK